MESRISIDIDVGFGLRLNWGGVGRTNTDSVTVSLGYPTREEAYSILCDMEPAGVTTNDSPHIF